MFSDAKTTRFPISMYKDLHKFKDLHKIAHSPLQQTSTNHILHEHEAKANPARPVNVTHAEAHALYPKLCVATSQ